MGSRRPGRWGPNGDRGPQARAPCPPGARRGDRGFGGPPGLSWVGEGRLGLPGSGVEEGCAGHPGRAASRRSAGRPPFLVGVSGLRRGTSAVSSHSPWGVASVLVFLAGSLLTTLTYISGPDLFPALPLPSHVSLAGVIGSCPSAFQAPPRSSSSQPLSVAAPSQSWGHLWIPSPTLHAPSVSEAAGTAVSRTCRIQPLLTCCLGQAASLVAAEAPFATL